MSHNCNPKTYISHSTITSRVQHYHTPHAYIAYITYITNITYITPYSTSYNTYTTQHHTTPHHITHHHSITLPLSHSVTHSLRIVFQLFWDSMFMQTRHRAMQASASTPTLPHTHSHTLPHTRPHS
jgi:hypothetical protein